MLLRIILVIINCLNLQLDNVVAAYRVANQYPTIVSAQIFNCSTASSVSIQSVWVQQILERQTKTKYRQTAVSDYKTYTTTSPPTDISNEYK